MSMTSHNIAAVLPAILETVESYRTACARFDNLVDEARASLNAAAAAISEAVAQCRELGLAVDTPFSDPDMIDRAFDKVQLNNPPIVLSCQL